jgi:flagellar operon protein
VSPISNPALVPPGSLIPTAPRGTQAGRVGGVGAGGAGERKQALTAAPSQSFADALSQADRSQLQFSKHALARVQRRGIELDASTLGRLSQGVQRAASKGSRDSLVLVDGTAFVVSVSNRTVITAVGSEHMKDNVFTNIDSAVIA